MLEKGELEEILIQNKMEKVEIDNLKERITKQLELVDAVLRDPSVLDYIEDYCDIFSKGNFENLRKVAKSMVTDNK